jgi:hypothetical protein
LKFALPATINAARLLAIAINLVILLFKESSSRFLSFDGTLCPIEDPLRWVTLWVDEQARCASPTGVIGETFSCQFYGGSLLPYLRLRTNRQRAGLFPPGPPH